MTEVEALNGVHILFFDMSVKIVKEWDQAFKKYIPERLRPQLTTLRSALDQLPAEHVKFDCIVSPANSYGRLDGRYDSSNNIELELTYWKTSFDYFLAKTLAPAGGDIAIPTRIAQATLYERWRGFAPPGTCTLVPLDGTECEKNQHDCHFIALCPTMRTPDSVKWDHEVVYECMWSLLVTIDNHNAAASTSGQPRISKVAITGLATGVGGVSAEKCAAQMALAVKHYEEAVSNREKWSQLTWSNIYASSSEVVDTRSL